ncbi:MAG: hypothetical protein ACPK85_14580 [Methanosarcina sp.]
MPNRERFQRIVIQEGNYQTLPTFTESDFGYFTNLTIGENSSAGKITIKNAQNKDSVIIDGANGDIILPNADCAEDFEISSVEQVDPGTVMALNNDGKLVQAKQPYDKCVAGVISGAGDLKPGLILGRQQGKTYKLPIALVGKVYCKIDADYESVGAGDLLTSSATPGHAMKASDPTKSFGAIIGKALLPLKEGKGLIPILVALQ